MTRFLLITIIIIGTVSLSRSQVVELIGEGVISENTYALEIPNPATVDHVIVEATAIFSEISEAEARNRTVTFSNTTGDNQVAYFQYTELNYGANANLDKYHTGYFSATFNDVGTGKIFLDKMGNGTSVISFTAYVYRIGSSGIYNTIIDDHAYVYHNGSANPVNYNFTIPHSGGYRDIVVKMPFTNLESDQLRWANIKLKAGSKIVSSEFQTNNSGELLRLETLVLTDVPGDVTEITLEIYSRKRISDENDGDSFITGPAVLYTTVGRDCGECEGQITTLELKYLGTETNATVKIYKDKVDKKKLLKTFTGINPGDKLAFSGTGKNQKMGAKIRLTINDSKEYTEIQTSCSQEIYAGMTYGEKFLIISGESYNGGLLCFRENMDEECSECEGQITALALEYIGNQKDAKVSIYKDKVENKKLIKSFLNVNKGDVLSFTGLGKHLKMGAKIRITINDSNQYTEIHTSCSKDIYAGMKFENKFLIVSGESHKGGQLCYNEVEQKACGECEGEITALELGYLGIEDNATVNIYKDKIESKNLLGSFLNVNYGDILSFTGVNKDSKMGNKILISVSDSQDITEIKTSCSNNIYVGMTFGNRFLIVSGRSYKGGQLCYKEYEEKECSECDGQITALDLEYLGSETNAIVKFYKDKVEPKNLIKSFTNVNSGDILSFTGVGKDLKMGAKIRITINDSDEYIEMHTSCSQDIYVGMTFEHKFLLVSGESFKGGPLCDWNVKKGKITSLDEVTINSDVMVYPNPVVNTATVVFKPEADGKVTMDLYNSLGQKVSTLLDKNVKNSNVETILFDGRNYVEGLYILVVQNGSIRKSTKIQISK